MPTMFPNRRAGFTLLEIVIIIVIIGVLAALGLPRLFRAVQFSYATEALSNLGYLRKELYYCYVSQGQDYNGCTLFLDSILEKLALVVIENEDGELPTEAEDQNFVYKVYIQGPQKLKLIARRTDRNGGASAGKIGLEVTDTTITKWGTGIFQSIR